MASRIYCSVSIRAILCFPLPRNIRTSCIPAICIWLPGPMEDNYMSDLMAALPTWTSPPFELAPAKRLEGSVIPRALLSSADRQRMYELLSAYFLGTSRELFERDLSEKEAIVLLRDRKDRNIQGFSTLMRLSAEIDGREVVAFFSGDTMFARDFGGKTTLGLLGTQTFFYEADRIR